MKVYRITPRNGEIPLYVDVKSHHPTDLQDFIEDYCGGSCSIKVIEMSEEKFNKIEEL